MMGAMVGFDTIGPVSAAAFSVATDAAVVGNTALMTTFGLCFAATGWIPLFAWLLHLITKKGPRFDGDDANLAMSGPINAFFDNMKLTVIFAAPYACRDPFRVIPCYLLTCSLTGLFSGAAGLANSLYTAPEKIRAIFEGRLVYLLPPANALYFPHASWHPDAHNCGRVRDFRRRGAVALENKGHEAPAREGNLCGNERRCWRRDDPPCEALGCQAAGVR